MATDAFLDTRPIIEGESQDTQFRRTIDVVAWEWGLESPADLRTGRRTGAVKADNLKITKKVDSASAQLLNHLNVNAPLNRATLILRKAGKVPFVFLRIIMHNVHIMSVRPSGAAGEEIPTERLVLNYERIEFQYTEQSGTGGRAGGDYSFSWERGVSD